MIDSIGESIANVLEISHCLDGIRHESSTSCFCESTVRRSSTELYKILKESLRLWPTAPAFAVYPYKETIVGGKYRIRPDQTLLVLLPMLHRDAKVWGADAEEFNPEHFAFERAEKLPPNAWKPFGNGQRSCIGRPFALQEATLVLAMILQRFDLTAADPNYELEIRESLTMKPHNLLVRARRRDLRIMKTPQPALASTLSPANRPLRACRRCPTRHPSRCCSVRTLDLLSNSPKESPPMPSHRAIYPSIGPLDSAAGHLPKNGVVVIVTASYEGKPPDNARQFWS